MDDQSVPERLLPFSAVLVELVRNICLQNILRGNRIHLGHEKPALRQFLETDWSCTCEFLQYYFDTGTSPTMPASEKASAVTRRVLPLNRRPEWKEVSLDNFVPRRYREADVRAFEAISRWLSRVGRASTLSSLPLAPFLATGFRSVPASVSPSMPYPISQRV